MQLTTVALFAAVAAAIPHRGDPQWFDKEKNAIIESEVVWVTRTVTLGDDAATQPAAAETPKSATKSRGLAFRPVYTRTRTRTQQQQPTFPTILPTYPTVVVPSPSSSTAAQPPAETPSSSSPVVEPAPTTSTSVYVPAPSPSTSTTPVAASPSASSPAGGESSGLPSSGLTKGNVKAYNAQTYADISVYHHNIHRRNHSAADVTWSADLATKAAQKAAKCDWSHENLPEWGATYGSNLAGSSMSTTPGDDGTVPPNPSMMISDMWHNGEAGAFEGLYGTQVNDNDYSIWGHFTQVVWPTTERIGCASSPCNGGWYGLCLYDPPGNYQGEYDSIKAPKGDKKVCGNDNPC